VVTTEDICGTASVKSDESFPPKRIKLDAIALILGMGDMHNNSNNNNNHNSNNNDTDLEDEFNSLQESVRQLSGSDIVEYYLSLLQRKGFIEYDYRWNNNGYRTTSRRLFILQLYQKIVMLLQ
jgi:hypothetical protein